MEYRLNSGHVGARLTTLRNMLKTIALALHINIEVGFETKILTVFCLMS